MSDPHESGRGQLATPYSEAVVREVLYVLETRGGSYGPAEAADVGLLWTLRRVEGGNVSIQVTGHSRGADGKTSATFILLDPGQP